MAPGIFDGLSSDCRLHTFHSYWVVRRTTSATEITQNRLKQPYCFCSDIYYIIYTTLISSQGSTLHDLLDNLENQVTMNVYNDNT